MKCKNIETTELEKKLQDFGYNLNNIDIESMKILIDKHKIDVNEVDSFGKPAWYRICSIKCIDKHQFEAQFNKQYEAIKLLFENGAKVSDDECIDASETAKVWKKFLLLVQRQNRLIKQVLLLKKYMLLSLFGTHVAKEIAQRILDVELNVVNIHEKM